VTEHSIEKLIFKSSDGGVFDTPKARHHLTAKWGWLAFYTAAKITVALTLMFALAVDIINHQISSEYASWGDTWIELGILSLGMFIFFVLEKNVFWGFRAYLDAVKRNKSLEEKIKSHHDGPIFLKVASSESHVPATRDRLLSLAFVLSQYLFAIIFLFFAGLLTFKFIMDGPTGNGAIYVTSLLVGPGLGGLIIWWVLKANKEVRLAFAGNATFQDDLEVLRNRNAELEARLEGFEGVSKEETLKLEEKVEELKRQAKGSEAALSQSQREVESLHKQLATSQSSTSDVQRALTEAQRSQGNTEKQLQQEKAARSAVETRLKNLASEFGQNCTVHEAFKALDETVKRKGGLEKLDADGMSLLAKLMRDIRETAPDSFGDAKSLSFVSAEEQRINQYDAIVRLYSQKIQKLRSSDMDEEEQQDAIDAMRRLRDREIAELEGAS
jgi:hypothetical protein